MMRGRNKRGRRCSVVLNPFWPLRRAERRAGIRGNAPRRSRRLVRFSAPVDPPPGSARKNYKVLCKAWVSFELATTKWDLEPPTKEDTGFVFWEKWRGQLDVLFPRGLCLEDGVRTIRTLVDQWRRDATEKLMLKIEAARREEMKCSRWVPAEKKF